MNATEELRRLLDERGVEWDADDETLDDGGLSQVTYWYCNGIEWSADGRDEYLAFDAVQLLTPEQAIAATLGSGTCTVKTINELGELYGIKLSCGHSMLNPLDMPPIYCPWCGKKVMEVDE